MGECTSHIIEVFTLKDFDGNQLPVANFKTVDQALQFKRENYGAFSGVKIFKRLVTAINGEAFTRLTAELFGGAA